MKDHPIPQDVTGYKFHIVGNMTLKQFGLIVFGVIVAFIIYQLKLPALIGWPFIVIFAGGGLLAAFIPIEERPLDHWILTFIKTLYRPTQFFWRREPHVPAVFDYVANNNQNTPPPTDLAPAKRARIHDYLNSLHDPGDNSETDEHSPQLAQILANFHSSPDPVNQTADTAPPPSMTVKVRALAPNPEDQTNPEKMPVSATTTIVDFSAATQTTSEPLIAPEPLMTPELTITPIPPANPEPEVDRTISQAASTVQLPTQTITAIDHSDQIQNVNESPILQPQLESTPVTPPDPTPPKPDNTNTISSITPESLAENTQVAQQPDNLPFPSAPSQPNVVVGMVVNQKQELLPGAIIEVALNSGQVVRVVRTNALGQFFVTTPLPNGSYVLRAEVDGLQFAPQSLEVIGQTIAPILFTAS